jgi:hypothetical protein
MEQEARESSGLQYQTVVHPPQWGEVLGIEQPGFVQAFSWNE